MEKTAEHALIALIGMASDAEDEGNKDRALLLKACASVLSEESRRSEEHTSELQSQR